VAEPPRRGLLARLGLSSAKPAAGGWQEADANVTVADAAAAARLAQEAATPFGYRRPAGELLAAFGGSGEEERRRATAALALAGVAADPPLTGAAPTQYVQLRRIEASASTRPGAAVSAAPAPPAPARPQPPAPAAAPEPPAPAAPAPADPAPSAGSAPGRPAFRPPASGTPVQRVAARFAPSAPVTRDRRIAAGALGLGALAVVMIVAVALRGGIGAGDDSVANTLPPATETTATATTAATTRTAHSPPPVAGSDGASTRAGGGSPGAESAPSGTTRAPSGAAGASDDAVRAAAGAAPAAPAAQPPRPRAVRLRVVPSEETYVCIADGGGATIWEGMLTGPYEVRRAKLVLRVGVATARITANGRPVRVTTAPGAFELTPTAIRELPGDQLVCGSATTAPPAGETTAPSG
jgi:hypothetical protein